MTSKCLKKIVIGWLSTEEGGAEESIRSLCSSINSQYNLEVDLVVWKCHSNASFASLKSTAVNVLECKDYSEYTNCLVNSLKENSESTVLIGNHRTFEADIEKAEQFGVKCAIVFRGIALPGKFVRLVSKITGYELKFVCTDHMNWKILHKAAAVVGISDCSAHSLRDVLHYPGHIYRIYNGVRNDWFVQNLSQIKVKKQVNRFLIASRLTPWKSIRVALEAFIKLAFEMPLIELNIIGDGEEKKKLKNIVSEYEMKNRIFFRGWQENPQYWYQNSDCLIHPSPMEGFGRIVAEANASGLLAVVPQSGAMGELVLNSHTGFTFEAANINSCYYALKNVVNLNAKQRHEISKRAFTRAKHLFNAHLMAEEYVNLASILIQNS